MQAKAAGLDARQLSTALPSCYTGDQPAHNALQKLAGDLHLPTLNIEMKTTSAPSRYSLVQTLGLALLSGAVSLYSLDVALRGPDAPNYYAYARSLLFDHDLLLINEFQRLHHAIYITSTGYASDLHNMGTAWYWLPFLTLANGCILLTNALLGNAVLSTDGFNAFYILCVNFGNWIYGLLALVFSYVFARRYASRRASLAATGIIALGSSYFYYMGYLSPGPGTPSALVGILFVFAWDTARRNCEWLPWLLTGALGGALLSLANINVVYLVFPLLSIATAYLRRIRVSELAASIISLAGGLVLGFLPQLIAWQILFGSPFSNPYAGQLDWLHPRLLEVLFSSYHGLIFYSPVLVVAILGLLPLWRRDRVLCVAIGAASAAEAYVSGANLGWWGGDSFGMRYFLGLTPLFIVALAMLLDTRRALAYHCVCLACVVWTVTLFLGIYSGHASLSEYYPPEQQLALQAVTLQDLPAILTTDLLVPRSNLVILMWLPFTLLTYLLLRIILPWLARPNSSRILIRFGLLLVILPIGLTLLARIQGAGHLAAAQDQEGYGNLPRANTDPFDLSYTYSERARYYFRNGDLAAAEADFDQAELIFPNNSAVVLFSSDVNRVPSPLNWPVQQGIVLAGYSIDSSRPGLLRLVLYWLVSQQPTSAFGVHIALVDTDGHLVGETNAIPAHGQLPFDSWQPGNLIHDKYQVLYDAGAASTDLQLLLALPASVPPYNSDLRQVTRFRAPP